MTDHEFPGTTFNQPNGSGEEKRARKRKWSRILAGVSLILYGLYHIAVQYYSVLDPRLLTVSGNGLAALVAYETGKYESAARFWRRHYGLTYHPASVDKLREMLEENIRKDPESITPYYLLADLYYSQNKYAEAAKTYQAALTRKKSDYEAQVGLATSLALQKDYRGANALFARLFRQRYEGRNIAGVLQVIDLLGRLEQRKGTENADLYLTLANVNRYLRILDTRRDKAVISYADHALALDESLYDAHFCKAVMFRKTREYDKALKEFNRVVEINPEYVDAYDRMGSIYGTTGDLEKELASYRRTVEIESDNPRYAFKLGRLLQKKYGDFREAAFYFRKALDLDPDDYDSMSWYGYSLMMLKEYDKALDVCAMMVERYPARPYGYKLEGDCRVRLKQYEEAVEWYAKSLDVAGQQGRESQVDFFQAFRDMGLAYRKLRRPDEAIAAYRQALNLKPHDVNTLYNLQYLYRIQGRYKEAYAAVKEILRIQPDHSGARRLVPYLQRNVDGSIGG